MGLLWTVYVHDEAGLFCLKSRQSRETLKQKTYKAVQGGTMTAIKQMVRYVVESLADKPEAVEVHESVGEGSIMVELKVAPEDMGRIIGRGGRHINAMRALVRVLGGKLGKRTSLELIESEAG